MKAVSSPARAKASQTLLLEGHSVPFKIDPVTS